MRRLSCGSVAALSIAFVAGAAAYGPKRDVPDDAPFVVFTDTVMALRHGTEPGS
jgi:hypothetical protein